MLSRIVGIAQAKTLMLHLTAPAASKRHKGGIATEPLLATRRFHQRCRGIATEPTMLAGKRLGFHAVVCHRLSCVRWWGEGGNSFVKVKSAFPPCSVYAMGSSACQPDTHSMALAIGIDPSTRDESIVQDATQPG